IWGGRGDDWLVGDGAKRKGQDVFVLAPNHGTDRIIDFQVTTDRIGLADGLTFDALEFSQSGKDAAVVDSTSGDTLALLQNVEAAALGRNVFVSVENGTRPERSVSDEALPAEPDSAPIAVAMPDPRQAIPPTKAFASKWRGDFSKDWEARWDVRQKGAWGDDNFEVLPSTGDGNILRVHYPKGSAAPSVSRKDGVPIGGGQFYADLDLPPQNRLRLSYDLRFSDDFDFVKGGKLPGLFGGAGASGGNIPDGTNGFSARLMWRRDGQGEVYAYLPTSDGYGTSIGRGAWTFMPGQWHTVEQEVVLNQPGQDDGQVRVWLDGNLMLKESGLIFRTTDKLKLDGLFFSTFFGGGDRSWSTPKDVHIDFANFSVGSGP
ncbi:MAG: polysaccharide lyase, partial [Elainellaceae cyanobacterium]